MSPSRHRPPPPAIPALPRPTSRPLRVFAFDPALATQLENYEVSEVTIPVAWEDLAPGPVGDYLEVVDVDPASQCAYPPLDLNHPHLLAQHGLRPSEGSPQFHQQMVYAVAMNTIRHFEVALGRQVFWSPLRVGGTGRGREFQPVARLRIHPHALREANAYYDPDKKALLFGYFPARPKLVNDQLPGGMVFSCLSHDIIAHETTHAILDGIQRYFLDPSNVDVLAFHEGFADLVALFQHFTYPEILRHQLRRARGDLNAETLLGQLAVQFGQATGGRSGLRDAIGGWNDTTKKWERRVPDPEAFGRTTEPHARGALLVAAVFDAFLAMYQQRTADLLRIATLGTGQLPPGELHPDLIERLAAEAAKTARHVLLMCIRAIDYCPPVDLTFGDYLRALITADVDLVPDDRHNYRVAVIEAFRRWGIYPGDVRTLSVESLLWHPADDSEELADFLGLIRPAFYSEPMATQWREITTGTDLGILRGDTLRPEPARVRLDRPGMQLRLQRFAAALHDHIRNHAGRLQPHGTRADRRNPLGLNLGTGHRDDLKFEVHSVRPVRRPSPDGRTRDDLLIQITQRRPGYRDRKVQSREDARFRSRRSPAAPDFSGCDFVFRGGATFLLDLETFAVRYVISKDIHSEARLARQQAFLGGEPASALREMYFGPASAGQRLAALHDHHHTL